MSTEQEDKKKGKNKWFDIHPPVFWPGAALGLLFIVLTLTLNNTWVQTGIHSGEEELGVKVRALEETEKEAFGIPSGVKVEELEEGFVKRSGVKQKHVITTVNGDSVASSKEFRAIMKKHLKGEEGEIEFQVVRPGIGTNIQKVFQQIQDAISASFGWFFILLVNIFLVFLLYLAFSKLGDIRLGAKGEEPEFSRLAWFSMLFSAGMGIGIIFWSVAEPMYHFMSPPTGGSEPSEAAETAMNFTFLHWGLHAWGIYALVGMALAFFAFNQKLPLSIRSVFYPLLGDRIHGFWGNFIDVLAVVSTLFGLATSLGFGVQQISAGLDYLGVLNDSVLVQVILIIIITGFATISVVLGIDKGVKVLSEWNIRIGGLFLLFMIIIGPTLFIFDSFVQNTGNYLQQVVKLSTWTETYSGENWQNSWTVFYWSWWIAWSPFVGMFIARVSRGRTVKEFVLGVLLVPSVLTFLWLSAFGGSAIYLELNGIGNIAQAVQDNVAVALFELLNEYPAFTVSSIIGIIMVTIFFVTSSDSGSLVVDSLTSGGKVDAPVGQRIFWAQTEGAVAAVLLIGGGLGALQTAVISTGLPFSFVLLVMCFSLYRGLRKEHAKEMELLKQKERESYNEVIKDMLEKRNKD